MARESWILGIAGVCFGILIGWIIGSQSAQPAAVNPPAAAQQSQPAQQNPTASSGQGRAAPQQPPALDDTQVRSLTLQAQQNPRDARVRAQLGNLFFDAERYGDAITWYEAALAIQPRDANISTDLAVSYYYTNQTDRALKQFETSLAIDPTHTKTLLNLGMVKAFGKQDLLGAAQAWSMVVKLAPDSPEGRAARQALESLKAAHPDPGSGSAPPATAGQPNASAPPKGSS
jgi:cytochrome c-type biogenesis protein CcmH/NrfG